MFDKAPKYWVAYDRDPLTKESPATLYRNMNYRNRAVRVCSGTLEMIQSLADELNGE